MKKPTMLSARKVTTKRRRAPTPAQVAARERFAEMVRSGAFTKKAKRNPAKKTVSQKISQLTREGYPQKQAVAIALSEKREGKVKANPVHDLDVAQTILAQLGGNRFIAMTGAKGFIGGSQFLGFQIPKNMSGANRVTITYAPSRDTYNMSFIKTARSGLDTKEVAKFQEVYADQLRGIFTKVTGMETSLGTMGRRNNPRASNPVPLIRNIVSKKKRQRNPAPKSYIVSTANGAGKPARAIATFGSASDAKQFAQSYADSKGKQMTVSS